MGGGYLHFNRLIHNGLTHLKQQPIFCSVFLMTIVTDDRRDNGRFGFVRRAKITFYYPLFPSPNPFFTTFTAK